MAKKAITNEFKKGLVMDYSPENTPESTLTNALNATLITYNGNELSLQNDMGNGRVETAFLPEGYMPLGTCEFGGIIYIVSYNPLIDKCLIGSFPSPERNISSNELGIGDVTILNSDFVTTDGNLLTLNKKYILNLNNLNPGDKYIVTFRDATNISNNEDYLSEISKKLSGNIVNLGNKKINLRIVSISDSNKVLSLDEFLKLNYESGDYFYKIKVLNNELDIGEKIDIDSYRNVVNQDYSVYSARTSGKLAILAELETIKSFSCVHKILINETSDYNEYTIRLIMDWESDKEDVNLSHLIISKLNWSKPEFPNDSESSIKYIISSSDYNYSKTYNTNIDSPNIYFNVPTINNSKYISGEITDNSKSAYTDLFKLRTPKNITIDDDQVTFTNPLILNYSVTPAMSFGKLSQLTVNNEINFSLIQTSTYDIEGFKYYITDDFITIYLSTLIYEGGFEEVKGIHLHFYNDKGYVGTHRIINKESYFGNFTITLNSNTLCLDKLSNSELTFAPRDSFEIKEYLDKSPLNTDLLYGIKIEFIIKDTSNPNSIKYKSICKHRWMYTTGEFNEFYYTLDGFEYLNPQISAVFTGSLKDNTTKRITNADLELIVINPATESFPSEYKTKVEYSGNIDLNLQLVSASKYFTGDLSGKAHVKMYYDVNKPYGVLENEIEINPSDYTFKIQNCDSNGEGSTEVTNCSGNIKIKVDVKTDFITTFNNISIESKQALVVTPIFYDNNYDELGLFNDNNSPMFLSCLMFFGSDDRGTEDSYLGWYKGQLTSSGNIVQSDEIDITRAGETISKNLSKGSDLVTSDYMDELGSKQPFSLFAVQPDDIIDVNGNNIWTSDNLVYSYESSNNTMVFPVIAEPTNKNNSWNKSRWDSGGVSYHLLDLSSYRRFYNTLLVTSNNARNQNDLCITSTGGNTREGPVVWRGYLNYLDGKSNTLFAGETCNFSDYSAFTPCSLRKFTKWYIEALSNICTVNPNIEEIEVYTGEINEESIIDKTILTNLLCYFDKITATNIKFNGEDFNSLCNNIKNNMGNPHDLLLYNVTLSDKISQEYCGTKETPAFITTINYKMLHEHEYVKKYLSLNLFQVYSSKVGAKNEILRGNLIPTKFYYWHDNHLIQMKSGTFSRQSNGKLELAYNTYEYDKVKNLVPGEIYYPKSHVGMSIESSKSMYKVTINNQNLSDKTASYNYAFIPGTTFIPEDFVWDVENEKHHFYFVNQIHCKKVNMNMAYLLDDDMEQHTNAHGIYYYKIGPSFINVPVTWE